MATLMRAVNESAHDARRPGGREARRGPPAPPGLQGGRAPALPPVVVDREKTCPLLLRVFPKLGGHHKLDEFKRNGELPKGEVQIYTWMDASLRELADLVKEVQPAARKPQARLAFSFVYPDRKGNSVMRQVGEVVSGNRGVHDVKTLKHLNFQTGDYLDVAIYP